MSTKFTVKIIDVGENEQQVFRVISSLFELTRPEIEEILETNSILASDLDKETAERRRERLERVGATVEVIAHSPEHLVTRQLVRGRVRTEDESPAVGLYVRVFHKVDLRNELLLSNQRDTDKTDSDGQYEVEYTVDEEEGVDVEELNILVRAYNVLNEVVAESDITFDAEPEESIDLVIDSDVSVEVSEYVRLLLEVNPSLGGESVTRLKEEERAFVAKDTRLDERDEEFPAGEGSLTVLSDSTRFASETELPTALFYGLSRGGVPLDPEHLSAENRDVLKRTLDNAIKSNVIPEFSKEELESVLDRVEETDFDIDRESPRRHRFSGRLFRGDGEKSSPLSGYWIRLVKPDGEPLSAESMSTATGNAGRFVVTYVHRANDPDPDELTLQVLDASDGVVLKRPFREVRPDGEDEPFEIRVPESTLPTHLIVPLDELQEETGLSVSRTDLNTLETHGVQSVADIRRLGLPDGIDDSTAASLQAHAVLNLLPSSLATDAELIERGYTHPALIAETSRTDFINSVTSETLTKQDAESAYHAAVAITRFAASRHTASRADWRNNIKQPAMIKAGGPEGQDETTAVDFPLHCSCDECETAVTPRAYLADLLDYTLHSLTISDSDTEGDAADEEAELVSLNFLTDTFFQPFVRLLESCDTAEDRVRYARLCGEVLLGHLGEEALQTFALDSSAGYDALFAYRREAYETLLSQLGTSHSELQDVVRHGGTDDKETLADRLGIHADHLSELLLSSSVAPEDEEAISERNLEALFGLQAFTDIVSTDRFEVPDQTTLLYVGQTGEMAGFAPTETTQLRRQDPDEMSTDVREVDADDEGTVSITLTDADVGDGAEVAEFEVASDSRTVSFTGSTTDSADTRLLVPDPLRHAGMSLPDQSLVHAWQLDAVRNSWRAQDYPEEVYSTDVRPVISPDLIGPDDFRNPDPDTDPAFLGVPDPNEEDTTNAVASRAFALWMQRRRWIDTQLQSMRDSVADTDGHALDGLIGTMDEQVRYGINEALESLEDIEGIGPERADQLIAAGFDTIEAVATASRDELIAIEGISESVADQIIASVFKEHDGAWLDAFDGDQLTVLLDDLAAEDPTTREEASDRVTTELHLGIEAFSRLMELSQKYERWHSGAAHKELQLDEWEEIYSILVQARKTSLFPTWIQEENERAILLGPRSFWIALSEPDEGVWPADLGEEYASELEISLERTPYIDPEIVGKDDLPDAVAGKEARELWDARTADLNSKRTGLEETYWDDGFDALLIDVYDDLHTELTDDGLDDEQPWASYFAARLEDINTGNQAELERITQDAETLDLSIDLFEQLAAMGNFAFHSEGEPPSEDDLTVIVAALTTAWKHRTKYPELEADPDEEPGVWIQEEEDADVRTYWLARKARLPRWRAEKGSRQAWQSTLRAYNRPPVLDPNLVAEIDLATPAVGDIAFELLVERRDQVEQFRTTVTDARSNVADPEEDPGVTAEQFDAMVDIAVGVSVADIQGLAVAESHGEDVSGRLEQLTLSRRAFIYLVDINDRLADADPITEEEWRNVDSILTQVQKKRHFATWRETEFARGLSLSPVFFAREEQEDILSQPTLAPYERWLHDDQVRRRWERTLEARIEQQESIAEALATTVEETEEKAVPMFRDALIDAAETPTSDATEWLTDRLRIDMQTDGCQETTRASQAIDVLQGLFFALETGTGLELSGPIELEITNDDHDEQWQWMQSYATWKAAMLVFMYPENFLLPTFRETQTPFFRDLVDELGLGADVTPSRSRWAADRYTDYLRDVFSLRVEATCEAQIAPMSETSTSSDESAQEPKDLVYMFAQGDETKSLYWSVYDYSKEESRSQSYWRPLLSSPEDTINFDIIGATVNPKLHSNGTLLLLLKQWPRGSDTPELAYATFDLDEQRWQQGDKHLELVSVPLPIENRNFTARLVQGCTIPQVFIAFDPRFEDEYEVRVLPHSSQTKNFIDANYILTYTSGEATVDSDNNNDTESMTDTAEWKPSRIKGLGSGRFLAAVAEPEIHHQEAQLFDHSGPSPSMSEIKDYDYNIFVFRSAPSGTGTGRKLAVNVIDSYHRPSHLWKLLAEGVGLSWHGALVTTAELKESKFIDHHPIVTEWGTERRVHAFWRDSSGQSVQSSIRIRPYKEGSDTVDSQSMILRIITISSSKPSFVDGEDVSGQFAISTSPQGTPDLVAYQVLVDQELTEMKRVRVNLYYSAIPVRGGTMYHAAPVKSISIIPEIEQQVADILTRRSRLTILHQDNLVPNSHQTYLHEAYYFVPLHLALQLQRGGHYEDALDWLRTIYDYSTESDRRISYLLSQENESEAEPVHERPDDWLYSGINPHAYASLRTNAYTRYTLFTIVKCLLDFADQEFTQDTTESVSRARKLYRTALTILESEGLRGVENPCDTIQVSVEEPEQAPDGNSPIDVWIGDEKIPIQIVATNLAHARVSLASLSDELDEIREFGQLQVAAKEIVAALRADDDSSALDRIAAARDAVKRIRHLGDEQPSFDQLLQRGAGRHKADYASIVADPRITRSAARIGSVAGRTLTTPSVRRAEPDGGVLEVASPEVDLSENFSGIEPITNTADIPIGTFIHRFCLPENPVLMGFRARAELNLHKIRTCRNISGMERELEPYAAPVDIESGLPAFGGGQLPLPQTTTIQPTPYRYETLIGRTKEVVSLARQLEADFLRFIERRDEEAFRLLGARQGIQQARANVRLQGFRVNKARDEKILASLQKQSAQIRADHYADLISDPLLWEEETALWLLAGAAASHAVAAVGYFGEFWDTESIASGFSSLAAAASTTAQVLSTWASYERREEEWKFQKSLAEQDIRIGNQQVTLAEGQLRIVGQERNIAELQTEHAEATVNFLTEKFTSQELFDWMAEVLEDVYRDFLQQATSMAKLAEHQLAFERQETPPQFIQADYWEPPQESTIGDIDATTPDRRGLTGAERLLQDIYELDQYAFTTDERKFHLQKTLSLARMAPFEFQEFRDTGVMTFATPMELFDRDHPGHHLRLIKRVDVAVIALTPPTEGVHATLTASGISRVVTPGTTFQTRVVRRQPESIALSTPRSDEMLLELRQESSDMLLPFEKMGVDTSWEFRMPEAANQFDYDTIADVLVTVHYTALDSYDYRQQVINQLGTEASGERAFSFRETFADQWYDLNNPIVDPSQRADGEPAPMTVQFDTTLDDFSPNIEDIGIDHVLMYFVGEGGRALDGQEIELLFDDGSGRGTVGGTASPVEGKISTRQTNGINWSSIASSVESISGEWTLSLPHPETRVTHPDVNRVRELFTEEKIEDVLFVITYTGRTPDWPE